MTLAHPPHPAVWVGGLKSSAVVPTNTIDPFSQPYAPNETLWNILDHLDLFIWKATWLGFLLGVRDYIDYINYIDIPVTDVSTKPVVKWSMMPGSGASIHRNLSSLSFFETQMEPLWQASKTSKTEGYWYPFGHPMACFLASPGIARSAQDIRSFLRRAVCSIIFRGLGEDTSCHRSDPIQRSLYIDYIHIRIYIYIHIICMYIYIYMCVSENMVTPHSSGLEPHCPYYDGHLWVCKSWHTLCLKKKVIKQVSVRYWDKCQAITDL